MVHRLKTWSQYYHAVYCHDKPFEVRKNERGFKEGDMLHLIETDEQTGQETGRDMFARISYVLGHDDHPGIAEGYVVLGLGRY